MFNNQYNTQSAGLSYRIGNRDRMFSIGANYQYAEMQSERSYPTVASVKQHFANVLPNLMLMAKAGEYGRVRLFYRSSTQQPSIDQLQDVYIYSGLTNVSIGNPGLKQMYGHQLAGRYNYSNTKNGNNFFANIFVNTRQDYIANAIYTATRADSCLRLRTH